MAGGFRPGGGRPKGSRTRRGNWKAIGLDRKMIGSLPRKTSKEYLSDLVNDPDADPSRRDRAAIALLPYEHARVADAAIGKKQIQAKKAQSLGAGTEWGNDLGDVVN